VPQLSSNLRIYLAMAKESAAESRRLTELGRTPRADGGFVVRHDPEHRSFKQSLIAIAFAGIFLEALMAVLLIERLGKRAYEKLDHRKWEARLEALGVVDQQFLARCKKFREARNELMHEKPIDWDEPGAATVRTGQEVSVRRPAC